MTKWIFIGLIVIYVVSPRTAQKLVDSTATAVVGTVRMIAQSTVSAAQH
jgi:hypothetical protein